jgi:hypothetical protein
MTPELELIALLLACAVFALIAERLLRPRRRRAWRRQWPYQQLTNVEQFNRPTTSNKVDAADQLKIVVNASFTSRPILNKGEARVFDELNRALRACNSTWQVMAQVSLGEILRSKDSTAFSCVNAKRVDLLLVDETFLPRHAIEYQGKGHHQAAAAARDAVKKEALRRAGIGYHEVVAGETTPAELRQLIERLVQASNPAPQA